MSDLVERFNRSVPLPLRLLLVGGASLGLMLSGTVTAVGYTVWAASVKIRGNAPGCPWSRILSIYPDTKSFSDLVYASKQAAEVVERDGDARLELIQRGDKQFWIRGEAHHAGAQTLLGYLIAEHDWIAQSFPERHVRSGDIVLDCGAHVGVFTRKALDRGAEKVVAIDPDPFQVECLRRNFADEIKSGRVVVVPRGVWSEEGTLTLHLGTGNSGMSSLVIDRGGEAVEASLTTIDLLVAELKLPRVDYIKLDIEGAEREAFRGAMNTLRAYRPRLLIDSYHREDDMTVLPAILAEAHPDYAAACGNCEPSWEFDGKLVPHFVFFQ